MFKRPCVHLPAALSLPPFQQNLTRWRGWACALALLVLLGLVAATAPADEPRRGAGGQGQTGVQPHFVPTPGPNIGPGLPQTASSMGPPPTHVAWAPSQGLLESEQLVYSAAVQSFREGRYAAAFGRFTQLAGAGHKASAESALFMLRHGPELFGAAWSASEDEQLFWQALVARNGRDLVDNPAGD